MNHHFLASMKIWFQSTRQIATSVSCQHHPGGQPERDELERGIHSAGRQYSPARLKLLRPLQFRTFLRNEFRAPVWDGQPSRRSGIIGLSPLATFLGIMILACTAAQARINVVSLPGRDSVQLTIYNSADLTLVKETRLLTFRQGINRLEFSWANTLIDPTSVEFRALTHADQVEVLDVSFPPRVTNTLEWRIQSEFEGEIQVEIRYFTSGISWSADYVAQAGRNEKQMGLEGFVRVNNNSGEDYENAQVRLVVGVIKLVEEISTLAQAGRPGAQPVPATPVFGRRLMESKKVARGVMLAMDAAAPMERVKEIAKEEMSEYFLYTVEGRDTIPNGWSKRLPSFQAKEVPIVSFYKYEKERWGDQVMRYYRFKNDKESHLGTEPLPDGEVKAFRRVTDDGLLDFVGRTHLKYIPINERVDMELGIDREVTIKPVLMNWQKTDIRFDKDGNVAGWTIKETWEFEVQNSKDIDITLDIRRHFSGDWTMQTEAEHERVDASQVKFIVPLKPREKKTFTYDLTVRHGLNASR